MGSFSSAFRLRSEGRGKSYTRLRGLGESAMRIAYRGDWPARAWRRFPTACSVARVHHRVALLSPGATITRIGFVSDLHVGPTTPPALLARAFDALTRARIDVLLLGGDYVFLDATEEKAALLERLVREVGAEYNFFVMGNHDLWTRHTIIERALTRAGAVHLLNRSVRLPAPHDRVTIVGLDDPWTGDIDARAAMRDVARECAPIILCHSPDGLPFAASALAEADPDANAGGGTRALFVCGHTHGGHVSTPFGPVVVPGRVGKEFPSGLHRVRGIDLYVSRGVGGIEVPVRTYARPEVAIFDLVERD
jgi:predicted MPP superfamily phosphohydrolase